MARLARLYIFPLKSFDPVEVSQATVLPGGALEHDRQFALFDAKGGFVNAKKAAKIHPIRSAFDVPANRVTFTSGANRVEFDFDDDRESLERWVGEQLGTAVQLRENRTAGFPDDTAAPGPTVIGSATLQAVADWFPGLGLDDVRQRFRANLEIEDEEPFWEDRLYTEEGQLVQFRIGVVEFAGTNPCQRCIVPTRSPVTGERYPEFGRIFEAKRFETLPYWATRSRFDHFYRLAVNTRPASDKGGVIRVGDEVEIL